MRLVAMATSGARPYIYIYIYCSPWGEGGRASGRWRRRKRQGELVGRFEDRRIKKKKKLNGRERDRRRHRGEGENKTWKEIHSDCEGLPLAVQYRKNKSRQIKEVGVSQVLYYFPDLGWPFWSYGPSCLAHPYYDKSVSFRHYEESH